MVVTPLCLGNISKDWPVDNMKIETRFNDYVYNFSVDYDAIAVEDVLDIHKNLMKKSVCRKTILSTLAGVNSLRCIWMTNKEYEVRPEIVNVNNN